MKKMFFVVLIVLAVLFAGCNEEPTGDAVGSLDKSMPAKEKPAPAEVGVSSGVEAECSAGGSQPCITTEECQGIQECFNGKWQDCKDAPNDGCPTGNCIEEWNCEEWTACIKGVQKRLCIDSHKCKTEFDKPDTIKLCEAK